MRNHLLRDASKVAIEALRVESYDSVEAVRSRRSTWNARILVSQPITGLLVLAGFVSTRHLLTCASFLLQLGLGHIGPDEECAGCHEGVASSSGASIAIEPGSRPTPRGA